jgi:nucleoside-diphosphate-sugar epimerase
MRIKDARQTFVGIWIRLILENKPFEVWEGHQLRDFTYVDDCVNALLLAATDESANGQIFNLGGNSVRSLKDLANLLVEINGEGTYTVHSYPPDRKKIDIGDYYSNFSKFNGCCGWKPEVSLEDGLARTLEFYKMNLPKYI